MRTKRTLAVLAASALAVAVVGPVAAQDATKDPGAAAGTTLMTVTKGPGNANPFWESVKQGALAAGIDYGVTVLVGEPIGESDVPSQINVVEDAITQGVAGISIAPANPESLGTFLQEAMDLGIEVVNIDTASDNEGVTFIGTNNEVGAAEAGKYLCENLSAGDTVAILQGVMTQVTGQQRAEGSKAALTECGLDIVAEISAEWVVDKGQAAMEDILVRNPDLKGLFASNDNMAIGALVAIEAVDMTGDIVIVGFDATSDAADAILAGTMDATIAQNPFNMGYLGIESLITLINGGTLEPVIDTGTVVVTAENAAEYTAAE